MAPLRSAPLVLGIMLTACEVEDPLEDDPVLHEGPLAESDSLDVQAPQSQPRKQEFAGQITVVDEDKLDPSDPTILQVDVPPGMEKWVFEGAKALVEKGGGDPGDIVAVVAAQNLMASIADAHAVVIATASDVSELDEFGLHTVSFEQLEVVHGSTPTKQWTARLDPNGSCGSKLPEPGTEWLVFLRVKGSAVVLLRGAPFLAVDAGTGFELAGLTATVPDLVEAVAAAQEVP